MQIYCVVEGVQQENPSTNEMTSQQRTLVSVQTCTALYVSLYKTEKSRDRNR